MKTKIALSVLTAIFLFSGCQSYMDLADQRMQREKKARNLDDCDEYLAKVRQDPEAFFKNADELEREKHKKCREKEEMQRDIRKSEEHKNRKFLD